MTYYSVALWPPSFPSSCSRPPCYDPPRDIETEKITAGHVHRFTIGCGGQPSRFRFLVSTLRDRVFFSLVPKRRDGTPFLEAPASYPITLRLPFPTNLDQSRLPQIIPRARITPMLRSIRIASRHRIVVNVLHLLAHDRLALDKLRVTAFLPNLIGASSLVGTLEYVSASRQDWKGVGLAYAPVFQDCEFSETKRPTVPACVGSRFLPGSR
uniref:Uncharacterized protein n=1 Tax=Candidatus Kentrum sp. LPFa TaxID=2126335 RepID=A0A450X1C2_9GAMM|nr:MAG: hypothetical protein BECKLPF1236A_GA0070988_103692 [Candidatus Kentron sp. LPFa]VFK35412.1 MAG: hypothetical protein BECKLPF1236C_GA0070990_103722 [Candidatus Kentron sp. LPFa]